ncbi:MAG: hypothetical protein ACJA08_001885 [Cyclobacteriaceae bacterium]|jgi:hypothetical protein
MAIIAENKVQKMKLESENTKKDLATCKAKK